MDDKLAKTLETLRSYIESEVRAGFAPVGDIPESGVQYLDGEADPDVLRPYAEKFTSEALVALAEEERSWPVVTDCDRLDAAFADLESQGIVARQNFTCCQTCGHAEIGQEIDTTIDAGRDVHGYTFYHWQDTEAAVEGHGVFLAYGATGDIVKSCGTA